MQALNPRPNTTPSSGAPSSPRPDASLPESVVVGLSAGAYTQGSPVPPEAPSCNQVTGFIDSYQGARGVPFDGTERDAAEYAARWVRCYNARCQLDNQQRRGMEPPPGAFPRAEARRPRARTSTSGPDL